jgi:hypothetical protein
MRIQQGLVAASLLAVSVPAPVLAAGTARVAATETPLARDRASLALRLEALQEEAQATLEEEYALVEALRALGEAPENPAKVAVWQRKGEALVAKLSALVRRFGEISWKRAEIGAQTDPEAADSLRLLDEQIQQVGHRAEKILQNLRATLRSAGDSAKVPP